MKYLLALLLLFAQDPDLDRLIKQLGDGDPARREEAVEKLRGLGTGAEEALKRAFENSTDPELRERATRLLQHFDRERKQVQLEAKERQKTFPRITADLVNVPLSAALQELARQSGLIWDTDGLVLTEKVTLKGKDLPLIEALERVGLKRRLALMGKEWLGEVEPAPVEAFGDGVRFTFNRRVWSPKGTPSGTIFETEMTSDFGGGVTWSIAGVRTDRDVKVETCAIHSPDLVYVADPALVKPRLLVKGTRLWFCSTPIEIAAPKGGEVRRIGPCQLFVQWPSIRVRLDQPMEESLLKKTLTDKDIHFKAKKGRERDEMGVGIGGGGGGRYGGRFSSRHEAWCGCDKEPATSNPVSRETAQEFSVGISFGDLYQIGDIESISITFHKPVEDAFELSSPPLK